MIRAVYEGVAFNSRWLLKYVEKFIGRRFEKINIIGGGANSEIWCQIHADVLNRPIHQVADPILANLRGAAWLAMVALGYGSFGEIAGKTKIAHIFEPNPKNKQLYDRLFQTYLKIYKDNKKIYADLNKAVPVKI
jgi:xylulokinase